jgi:tetratricopeptide (TPR) repeat protein
MNRTSGAVGACLLWCCLAVTCASGADTLSVARSLKSASKWPELNGEVRKILPSLRQQGQNEPIAEALALAAESSLALGGYESATKDGLEAARRYQELGRPGDAARCLNYVGLGMYHLGRYGEALDFYGRALALRRATNDPAAAVLQLNNIANVYMLRGAYSEAWRTYEDALREVRNSPAALGIERARYLIVANLATLYQRVGREDRALEMFQQLGSATSRLSLSEQAQMAVNIGVVYRRLGDPYKAMDQYRYAQSLYAKEKHLDGQIGAGKNLGIVLALDLNRPKDALVEFDAVLGLATASGNKREILQAQLYRAEALRRLNDGGAAAKSFQDALGVAKSMQSMEETWKAQYGLGQIAESHGDVASARACYDQAIHTIESARAQLSVRPLRTDFLGDKRDVFDRSIALRLANAPDVREIFRLMEASRSRILQDQIRTSSLEAIVAKLDDQTALLEYWKDANTLVVLCVTRQGTSLRQQPLPQNFTGSLYQWLDTLKTDDPNAEWRALGRTLGRMLIPPSVRSGRFKRLLIAADAELNLIPFDALELPNGRLVVEDYETISLPTASFVAADFWAARAPWRWPWQTNALALGNPVLSSRGIAGESAAALPGSAAEVAEVARNIPGTDVALGADARKDRLQVAGRLPPVIHIASHAVIDERAVDRSRILFSPPVNSAEQDYLFYPEITSLHLSETELVTLSACDTERGEIAQGEGVHSLNRAFLEAGARSTVSTLWPVEDRSTATFMRLFYRRLAEGMPVSKALREAKTVFLQTGNKLAQPKFWAAFVVMGNGASAPATVITWTQVTLGMSTVVLIGIVAYRIIARR